MAEAPAENATLPPAEQRLAPGEHVGRYRITRALGSGGMGMVYAARDDTLGRTIALKLVYTGDSSSGSGEGARSRVLREAKAIAKLSHPNVIAVYDVGTFRDEVFLAMELAEKGTLRDVLAAREHTWREVLTFYLEAGRGLAAAHAVGLVHRDFKPDNVLVGGDGRAKVADFGIARALEDGRAPSSASNERASVGSIALSPTLSATLTQTGTILGTPAYMAPEQMRAEPADARADVFSFCVALYEGLYGDRPFAGRALVELRANVEAGRIEAAPAGSRVPDWVRAAVVRGLAHDASARWPSMRALLDALERDPEAMRRRGWLAVGAAFGLVAVVAATAAIAARGARPVLCAGAAGAMTTVWGPARAAEMETAFLATGVPFVHEAFAGAKHALDAYAAAWVSMQTDACEATRVRREQSEELLDLRVQCLRESREELGAIVKVFGRADPSVVERAQSAVAALTPLDRCADTATLRSRRRVASDPKTRARLDDLAAELAEARALYHAGDVVNATRVTTAVLEAAREAKDRALTADALQLRGAVLLLKGDYAESERASEEATLAAVAGRDERAEAEAWSDLVRARAELQHVAAARDAAAHAYACVERLGDDALLATVLTNDSFVHEYGGDYEGEVPLLERARDLRAKLYGEAAPEVALTDIPLARAYSWLSRYDDAIAAVSRAIDNLERAYGPMHPAIGEALETRGASLACVGRFAEARADATRTYELFERALGKDNLRLWGPLSILGNVDAREGDYAGAVARGEGALALKEHVLGPNHPFVADALDNLVGPLVHLGRLDDARRYADRELAIYEATYPPDHAFLAWPLTNIGVVDVAKHAYAEAIPLLERALALREAHPRDAVDTADTQAALGRALYESGKDRARGKALVEAARAAYAKEPARKLDRVDAERTLARYRE